MVTAGATATLAANINDTTRNIVSYQWVQAGGLPVTLENADTANATFKTASITSQQQLVFTLVTKDDQGVEKRDEVVVTVKPAASTNSDPTVDAGNDSSVAEGATVNLEATATDSDGTIASYVWTQAGGTTVTLTGADTATPSFTVPNLAANEDLTFSVTVTDDKGATATDRVVITVQDSATVAGVIIDEPVRGATVTITDRLGHTYTATTDDDGKYTIPAGIPKAKFPLTVKAEGGTIADGSTPKLKQMRSIIRTAGDEVKANATPQTEMVAARIIKDKNKTLADLENITFDETFDTLYQESLKAVITGFGGGLTCSVSDGVEVCIDPAELNLDNLADYSRVLHAADFLVKVIDRGAGSRVTELGDEAEEDFLFMMGLGLQANGQIGKIVNAEGTLVDAIPTADQYSMDMEYLSQVLELFSDLVNDPELTIDAALRDELIDDIRTTVARINSRLPASLPQSAKLNAEALIAELEGVDDFATIGNLDGLTYFTAFDTHIDRYYPNESGNIAAFDPNDPDFIGDDEGYDWGEYVWGDEPIGSDDFVEEYVGFVPVDAVSVQEGDAITLTFSVDEALPIAWQGVLTFGAAGDTAQAGTHYTQPESSTINFAAGATEATVTIQTVRGATDDYSDYQFTVSATPSANVAGEFEQGAAIDYVVTITNHPDDAVPDPCDGKQQEEIDTLTTNDFPEGGTLQLCADETGTNLSAPGLAHFDYNADGERDFTISVNGFYANKEITYKLTINDTYYYVTFVADQDPVTGFGGVNASGTSDDSDSLEMTPAE
ncbi:hypothetical protein D5085_18445 [Ectothiorhodospiraceae bacterium BW-2]|nr:hypothetical protein D5085_18445 [Ectothiorhodospiraceae bacterium BW-2]